MSYFSQNPVLFSVLAVLAGFLAGALVFWLYFSGRLREVQHQADLIAKDREAENTLWEEKFRDAQEDMAQKEEDIAGKNHEIRNLTALAEKNQTEIRNLAARLAEQSTLAQQVPALRRSAEELQAALQTAKVRAAQLQTRCEEERAAADEKIQLLNSARATLTAEFQNLADKILEEKSQKFTEQNQSNIKNLMTPVQEKMQEFSQLVDRTHKEQIKDSSALREHLSHLEKLNRNLSEEATKLTRALTQDNKKQGNWGEMILESVLQHSGLRKGEEYTVQSTYSLNNADNDSTRYLRPDAVISLPDNRQIVIDAKVSLTDFTSYCNAEDENAKKSALKAHLISIENHIKELAEKNYQSLPQLHTVDFVLMFIPIEAAYLTALQEKPDFLTAAFARNIMPVSPGTLLAVLRTIALGWQSERQNRNALQIATVGGRLYDKFAGVYENLEKLGTNLNTAQKTLQTVQNQLKNGSGNLIAQVEKLKKLGAKTAKTLPAPAEDDDSGTPPENGTLSEEETP